ncbi:hypothetical protein HanIR_Chr15g0730471 [Helianthus annuus]|nr:hypothetical protein HanIR_Chr15g0730471 [Helianthus annuus]
MLVLVREGICENSFSYTVLQTPVGSGGLIVQIGVARATPQPYLRSVKIPFNSIFLV